jgi:hypothetical protein
MKSFWFGLFLKEKSEFQGNILNSSLLLMV